LEHAEVQRRRANAAAGERQPEQPRVPGRRQRLAAWQAIPEIAAFGVEVLAPRRDDAPPRGGPPPTEGASFCSAIKDLAAVARGLVVIGANAL
jgi:hypothetical protein